MIDAKTRFVIEITGKLSAAPDSDAKLELIEELSENLYSRYQDMTAAGTPEDEAYRRALGELGDVDELLAYLEGLGPEGTLPRREARDPVDGLLQDLGGLMQEAVGQAQNAIDGAAALAQEAADRFQQARAEYRSGWTPVTGEDGFSSEQICAIEVSLASGDVKVVFDPDPDGPVRLAGDTGELEVHMDENGLFAVRQERSAIGMFFRAFRATDLELTLPRRHWESVRITTASGDVDIGAGLVTGGLYVKTASGGLDLCHADCGELVFQSASGDFNGENLAGSVCAGTASGDISLSGMLMLQEVRCTSASGDIEVCTGVLPQRLELSSKSGDCKAELPDGEGFAVKFHTVSGDMACDFPLSGSLGRRSGEGVYLDGGSAVLSLSTVSGDIELRRY